MSALRPCIEARCPRLTSKTRCQDHQRGRDRARNAARADVQRPYQSPRWLQLRAEVVRGGRCHWCGVTGKRLVGDHVVPISQGGAPFDPSNVVPACYSCNNRRRTRDQP